MRKEIYEMLCERLGNIPEIKYIDLWNHNVEFIEQEDNWERPAVFVELCPINWEAMVAGGDRLVGQQCSQQRPKRREFDRV